MIIEGLSTPVLQTPLLTGFSKARPSTSDQDTFAALLSQSLHKVNQTTSASSAATEKLLTGEIDSLHEVSLASAKKNMMMKLTTVRAGKLATATSTVMQMQI